MLNENIFSQYKTKADFDREREEFEARKRQRELQEQLGNVQLAQAQRQLQTPDQQSAEQVLAEMYRVGGFENLTPQQQAQLQAFDAIRTSQLAQNPLTGGIYAKNQSILGMPPRDAMAMPISSAAPSSMGGFSGQVPSADDVMLDQMQQQIDVAGGSPMTAPPALPEDMGADYVGLPSADVINQVPVQQEPVNIEQVMPQPIQQPSMQGMYLPAQQDVLSYAAKKNVDLQALNQQERIKVMNELAKEMQLQGQKTEREKIQKRRQEDFAFESALGQKDVVDSAINQIVDQVTAFNTGVVGSRNPFSQSGANIEALLKTVESDATLSKLVELKQAGGTLGQVTEKELALLQSSRAALARIQDPGQFIEQLSKYKNARNRAINNIANAYNKEFGEYPTGYTPLSQPRQISAREFLSQ